jgi:WhiB family redox-sensing transcriptional regulator
MSSEWRWDAVCATVDPDLWFPETGKSTRDPKALCRRCPVTAECLQDALDHNDRYGIRGGLSPNERHKLRMAS